MVGHSICLHVFTVGNIKERDLSPSLNSTSIPLNLFSSSSRIEQAIAMKTVVIRKSVVIFLLFVFYLCPWPCPCPCPTTVYLDGRVFGLESISLIIVLSHLVRLFLNYSNIYCLTNSVTFWKVIICSLASNEVTQLLTQYLY